MSDGIIALFIGAGCATLAYTQFGKRVGYGNDRLVWTIVAIAFVFCFLVSLTFIKYVLHIG